MICYVYKWTHIPTLSWYVGSRTRKNCHPDDGYICSSKRVKPLIKANPHDWKREIIATGTKDQMKQLEQDILIMFDAMYDPRSFNLSNGAGAMRPFIPWNKGKKGLQVSWNKGLPKEQQPGYGVDRKGQKYTVTEKFLTQQRAQNKKRNAIQLECPHCKKAGQMVAMKRWHFDNCPSLRK